RPDVYPKPDRFRPERFVGVQPDTYAWLPFGGSIRRCIGASFAMFEMKVVIPVVLRELRLRAATPKPEPMRRRAITFVPAQDALVVARAGGGDGSGFDNEEAAGRASTVLLAVPFRVQAENLNDLRYALQPQTILIDATVPLAAAVGGRATRTLGVWQGSAAQQTAELVPKGVSVVGAFHNVSADVLNGDEDVDCDVIACSDDAAATQIAMELAAKIPGIRAIDGGKLENVRIVEQITALLIGLNIRHKGHGGVRITGLPEQAYNS